MAVNLSKEEHNKTTYINMEDMVEYHGDLVPKTHFDIGNKTSICLTKPEDISCNIKNVEEEAEQRQKNKHDEYLFYIEVVCKAIILTVLSVIFICGILYYFTIYN